MTQKLAGVVRSTEKRGEIISKAIAAGFSERVVPGLLDFLIEELADEPEAVQSRFLGSAGLSLDLDSHEATYQGKPISLTVTEFRLVEYFLRNPGRLLTHQMILSQVWGIDDDAHSRQIIRVYLSNLRGKTSPDFIRTKPGEGYILPLNG